MNQDKQMRLRITFAKTEHMRYTGNLDLQHTLERTLRRADLPIAHSQGFTPRPKIHIASALPLGFTSDCEVGDIWIEGSLPLEEIRQRFTRACPPGIQLHDMQVVEEDLPALQNSVDTAGYTVTFLDPVPDLAGRVQRLLESPAIPRERRDKVYDLRPLILEVTLDDVDAEGQQRVKMLLKAQPSATGRPDEVVAAMGLDPTAARFHRTLLLFSW